MRRASFLQLATLVLLWILMGRGLTAQAATDQSVQALLPSLPTPLGSLVPDLPEESPTIPVNPSPNPTPTPTTVVSPLVVVNPPADSSGAAVVVEGSNWKPLTTVHFYFRPSDTSTFLQGMTDRNGRFGLCFELPQRSIGSYQWRVCQNCGTPAETKVDVPFVVTSRRSAQQRDPRCPSAPRHPLALSDASQTAPTPTPTGPAPVGSPRDPNLERTAEDELEKQTEKGYIAFNPSREMRVKEPELIEVSIQRKLAEELTEDVKERLSAGLSGEGKVEFDTIDVGKTLVVRLDGDDNFKIHPITSEERTLGNDVVKWMWNVTPLKRGRHTLYLCVDVPIEFPGRAAVPHEICPFARNIEVKVNPIATTSSFLGQNWEWLIGGPIGTAAIAWASRQSWVRRKKQPTISE